MKIIIYLDSDKNTKMVLSPSEKFDGNIRDLVLHVTHSSFDRHNYIKNYHSFEIINL